MSESKGDAKDGAKADLVEIKLAGGRDKVDVTLAAKLVEPILKAVEEKKVVYHCCDTSAHVSWWRRPCTRSTSRTRASWPRPHL